MALTRFEKKLAESFLMLASQVDALKDRIDELEEIVVQDEPEDEPQDEPQDEVADDRDLDVNPEGVSEEQMRQMKEIVEALDNLWFLPR